MTSDLVDFLAMRVIYLERFFFIELSALTNRFRGRLVSGHAVG